MINFILALFSKYTTMTREEAEAIADELNHSIQPHNFEDAQKLVDRVISELDKKK